MPRKGRMPENHATRLLHLHSKLPPRPLQYRCAPGQRYVTYLAQAVELYGPGEVARALGTSPQTIRYVLRQRLPDGEDGAPLPEDEELGPVLAAYKDVLVMREANKQVRRTTPQYAAMHAAMKPLAARYPIDVIAQTTRIPAEQLRRFAAPPDDRMRNHHRLHELAYTYHHLSDSAFLRSPRGKARDFLVELAVLNKVFSQAQIAHALGVKPATVQRLLRQWAALRQREGLG